MKVRRRLLAWMLTIAMIVPVLPVCAVENNNDEIVTSETANTTEEAISSEENQTEASSEADTSETANTEEAVSTEESDSLAVCETETESQPETETESATEEKIEELGTDFVLSKEEKELKLAMAGTIGELSGARAGIDYVENEVFFLADDKEEAEAVAEAYSATLSDYDCGVATIVLPDEISVAEAVKFAADEDNNMLAVMPNYYAQLYEDFSETELFTEEENTEVSGYEPDILEVYETEIDEDEELELEANVDAAFTDPYLYCNSNKYQYQHNSLGSFYAWKAGYKGSGVKVAVIDSGVNAQSGELEVAKAINKYSGGSSAADENGHGTHVAGIIAARLNGSYGAGVAPEATIINIRVGDADGSITYADEYRGLEAAVTENVDIVNMSLGGVWSNPAFQQLVNQAYNNGIMIFASSGNSGGQIDSYPACYDHVFSVGSTNEVDNRSDFSNTNKRVAFCGPGSRIWSVNSAGGDYVQMSGTSMSCPAIAGVAAVLLSTNKSLLGSKSSKRVDDLAALMTKSSKFVMAKCGSGIPYLPKALGITTEGDKPVTPSVTTSISADYKTINVTITGQTYSNLIYTVDGRAPSLKAPVAGQVRVNSNTTTFTIPVSKNRHTINAIAINESGLASTVKSVAVSVKPVVASINISGITKLAAGKSATLTAEVLPAIAVNKKLKWSISPAGNGVTVSNGRVAALKTATPGTYTITATADDNGGASKTYKVQVLAGEYIKSVAFTEKQIVMNRKSSNTTRNISSLLNGQGINGSSLAVSDFVWSSNKPSIATVSSTGVVTATGAGTAVITALANDGSGKKATISVKVNQQISSITLNCASSKVAAGKKVVIKPTLNPEKPTSQKLIWSVSPAGRGVNVVNGNVTVAKDAANTEYTITATAADGGGATASKKITVISGGITKLTPNVKSEVLFRVSASNNAGVNEPTSKVIRLAVTGDPGADLSMIAATSNNTGIVNVSSPVKNGNYYDFTITATGNNTGNAAITFTSTDGSAKVAKVNVKVINPASSIAIASVNAEYADKIIEGKTVRLAANLGTLYGTPSTKKIKWTIKSVTNGKSQYVNVAGGVVKVKNGVGHGTVIVVNAELDDGSGLSTDITLKTVAKENAIAKMYLADWNRYWNYYNYYEIDKTVYLKPNPEEAVFIGGVMRVVARRGFTTYVYDVMPDSVHFACSSGNNDVATPVMNGAALYVSPKKQGSTTILVADKVSGKFCKYRIVVTSDPRLISRTIN